MKNLSVLIFVLFLSGSLWAQVRTLPQDAEQLGNNTKAKAPVSTTETIPKAVESAPPVAGDSVSVTPPPATSPEAVDGLPVAPADTTGAEQFPVTDYKSDLPAGWEPPPEIKEGEIPLDDLSGKNWRPAPASPGGVDVEEKIPGKDLPESTIKEEEKIEKKKNKSSSMRWNN